MQQDFFNMNHGRSLRQAKRLYQECFGQKCILMFDGSGRSVQAKSVDAAGASVPRFCEMVRARRFKSTLRRFAGSHLADIVVDSVKVERRHHAWARLFVPPN